MGSPFGDWPSYDPHNFSQLRPADPSGHPLQITLATYYPTHSRTSPPDNQVITTEATNILLRHLYQRAEPKARPKRPAADAVSIDHANKHPRITCGNGTPYMNGGFGDV
ncbi:unnamed protein product [Calypogeia fissa]